MILENWAIISWTTIIMWVQWESLMAWKKIITKDGNQLGFLFRNMSIWMKKHKIKTLFGVMIIRERQEDQTGVEEEMR